jgi:dTDP-4-dehydrorhamnose 3,5-epimerase
MEFVSTDIPDVLLIKSKLFADARGYFMETFRQDLFADSGINEPFVQDNMSSSVKGTLRGLHYQLAPHAQGKLVRVIRGAVYDVAADIRRGSPTFGKWVGVELSESNKLSMYIPAGFAHGFYVLSDTAEFIYKCTSLYMPQAERGIVWNDPDLNIYWPIDPRFLILSDKDRLNPMLKNAEMNF